jgi:hypothetical protein
MTIAVTESGASALRANLSAGAYTLGNATIGGLYASDAYPSWSYPNNIRFELIPPSMTFISFYLSYISLTVTLKATQTFTLYFSNIISLTTDVSFGGTLRYGYAGTQV